MLLGCTRSIGLWIRGVLPHLPRSWPRVQACLPFETRCGPLTLQSDILRLGNAIRPRHHAQLTATAGFLSFDWYIHAVTHTHLFKNR
jgi:hypothetical protein